MKIQLPEMHYHSITCHVPCITVPLTALFYGLFLKTGNSFFNVSHLALMFVTFASFFVVFPTGYLEREKKYTNWANIFKFKTVFSFLHIATLLFQFIIIYKNGLSINGLGTIYAILTIGIQTLFILILTWLGIITAQGRVLGSLSYKGEKEAELSYDIIKIVKETQPDPLKEPPYDRF